MHNTLRSEPIFFQLYKRQTWKLRLKMLSLARGHPAERDSNHKRGQQVPKQREALPTSSSFPHRSEWGTDAQSSPKLQAPIGARPFRSLPARSWTCLESDLQAVAS